MSNLSILREYIATKKHHIFRKEAPSLCEEYASLGLSPEERMTRRFETLTSLETPVILEGERISFLRTVKNIPDVFTADEWAKIKKEHFIHELGYLSNVSPDYETVIRDGFLALRERADEYARREIDAIVALCDRYVEEAKKIGREDLAERISYVSRHGARDFYEALQLFRILHFSLWLEGNYHVTVGRFDQYMMPYLQKSLDDGMTEDEALDLLTEFFLTFNRDSDTYVGVQQGDNGQSMVLGGMTRDGKEGFNTLSRLALVASRNLLMIDPKINLRVSKNTPEEIFDLGSELTKAGLGFPQYSNDDVVIDGLVSKGYDLEDARDYVVAACWEFIVPKVGMDVANIGALSFPRVVNTVLHDGTDYKTYNDFRAAVRKEIFAECDRITDNVRNLWFVPSPLMNTILYPKYHNFGIHGTGNATASDSLAALKKYVFDEKTVTLDEMRKAVDTDFADAPELLHALRYDAPKMGQNEESADEASCFLLSCFADALEGRKNCLGGIWRAGTGSAMYYLWHAAELPASPDGRRKGEPFGANFSPSLFTRTKGPFSVVNSFTKQDFRRAINGGPLTMEFSSTIFAAEDGVHKTALLVRAFVLNGGHQLQLNSVNPETMRHAQEHPEEHAGLIVRIWGWSAYFTELDKEYQDHVIARQEYQV